GLRDELRGAQHRVLLATTYGQLKRDRSPATADRDTSASEGPHRSDLEREVAGALRDDRDSEACDSAAPECGADPAEPRVFDAERRRVAVASGISRRRVPRSARVRTHLVLGAKLVVQVSELRNETRSGRDVR